MKFNHVIGALALLLITPLATYAGGGETIYRFIESSGDASPYAVHLPPGFDPALAYPVLIGPGDGEKGAEPGFYWRTDPNIDGWIIVDAQIWDTETTRNFDSLLDAIAAEYKVDSVLEIVPDGEHVMTNLIGEPFIQKLEKLR